jgi:GST-like protein
LIEFHAATTPNTLKVFFMLGETGLPFRLHRVRLLDGDQFTPEFRKLHPHGKVPAIVDTDGPDGKPHTVFESGAILIYLAEKTGRLLGDSPAARSTILQWLILQMSTVGPMIGQATHFARIAAAGNDYARRRYVSEAVRLCETFDARLRGAPYLGGAQFSIADIAAFPWFWRHPGMVGIDCTPYTGLRRWMGEIEIRPGFRALYDQYVALYKQDGADREKATPDQVDRFLGRGDYFKVP